MVLDGIEVARPRFGTGNEPDDLRHPYHWPISMVPGGMGVLWGLGPGTWHPMGKKSRTPSAEARVVGTKQQFRKSKGRHFFTRLTFPLLGFYLSSLFPPFLLVLLFF